MAAPHQGGDADAPQSPATDIVSVDTAHGGMTPGTIPATPAGPHGAPAGAPAQIPPLPPQLATTPQLPPPDHALPLMTPNQSMPGGVLGTMSIAVHETLGESVLGALKAASPQASTSTLGVAKAGRRISTKIPSARRPKTEKSAAVKTNNAAVQIQKMQKGFKARQVARELRGERAEAAKRVGESYGAALVRKQDGIDDLCTLFFSGVLYDTSVGVCVGVDSARRLLQLWTDALGDKPLTLLGVDEVTQDGSCIVAVEVADGGPVLCDRIWVDAQGRVVSIKRGAQRHAARFK
eukprot:gene21613-38616_t